MVAKIASRTSKLMCWEGVSPLFGHPKCLCQTSLIELMRVTVLSQASNCVVESGILILIIHENMMDSPTGAVEGGGVSKRKKRSSVIKEGRRDSVQVKTIGVSSGMTQ